jgi:hypothetical protein
MRIYYKEKSASDLRDGDILLIGETLTVLQNKRSSLAKGRGFRARRFSEEAPDGEDLDLLLVEEKYLVATRTGF